MTNKAAALRYARALFDVALQEKGDLRLIERQLGDFVELLAQHHALEAVLLNPAVPAPRKRGAVADLTSRVGVTPVLAKLLALLAERDRLVLLRDLLASYRDKLLDHEHVVRAEVTTAGPLAGDRLQELERQLGRVAGRRVSMSTRVDPAIIGGVVARIGSTVYDGSVVRQLEKIKHRLLEGT